MKEFSCYLEQNKNAINMLFISMHYLRGAFPLTKPNRDKKIAKLLSHAFCVVIFAILFL